MKKDTKKTEVIFLIEKPEGDLKCNVFAFFPKEYYNKEIDTKMFNCYAHLGQHSGCHIDYAKECKKATKKEYESLKNELISIGYNLNIIKKFSQKPN